MTVAEYQLTPEIVTPQELIFGQVEAHDAPTVPHQRVVLALAMALHAHCRDHGGEVLVAPTDVVLDVRRALVLQPDLLYVGPAGAAIVGDRVDGPPDLVVEVLSPYPRIGRVDEKVRWYSSYGVHEIWLYHLLAKRLEILYCGGGGVVSTARFGSAVPIQSLAPPGFRQTIGAICGSYGL
jgi:Uma2 family endonuclease